MGRKYQGLDKYKITVKLTYDDMSTLRERGRKKEKHVSVSEEVRDLCAGARMREQLSDIIENKLADLEVIAKIFEMSDDCEIYARAVKEAICVMKVLRDY